MNLVWERGPQYPVLADIFFAGPWRSWNFGLYSMRYVFFAEPCTLPLPRGVVVRIKWGEGVQKRPQFCTRSILFCILSGEQLSQGFAHVRLISKKPEIWVGDRWWAIGKDRMKSLTVKQCSWSVSFCYGFRSGSGSWFFLQWLSSKMPTRKLVFSSVFFFLINYRRYIFNSSVFKD